MVQWIKRLLCKHLDLNSNPQNSCKADVKHICNLRASVVRWEADTRECPKATRSASLVHTEEQGDFEPKKKENKNNIQAFLLTPTHAQWYVHTLTYMCACVCAHTHTEE